MFKKYTFSILLKKSNSVGIIATLMIQNRSK